MCYLCPTRFINSGTEENPNYYSLSLLIFCLKMLLWLGCSSETLIIPETYSYSFSPCNFLHVQVPQSVEIQQIYSLANVLVFIGATVTKAMSITNTGLINCSHYVSLFRYQFIYLLLVMLQTGRVSFLFAIFKNSIKIGGKIWL